MGLLGLVVCVLFSLQHNALPEGLSPEGLRTLGCAWLMAWWWIGSGLPLAVPSLVPLAAFPTLGILDSKAVAAPYADRIVILLLCGFLLALAVEKWKLHERIALHVLLRAGATPAGLVAGVMAITAVLSMWISNTATTLMMLPIVLALVDECGEVNEDHAANRRFGQLMLLALAYSASIGGMATPVGTPPNLFFQSAYSEAFPEADPITFASWMRVALPVSLVMLGCTFWLLTKRTLRLPPNFKMGERSSLQSQIKALGPLRTPEIRVALGFGLTCALWILRDPLNFPAEIHDSTIAAAMAIVFFLAPSGGQAHESKQLLVWKDADAVPWGLLLLFGGGIALSVAFKTTGLTVFLGEQLSALNSLPTVAMILGICLAVTFLTEVTSNTATTSLILPVLAATAVSASINPLLLMVPATLAASCAFMLPVATAPNAIVVGSGAVDQATMVRSGFRLNLLGTLPITFMVWLLLT
ncbi:MAG: SLC13 family permease [Myxococcota bacterium]|nr:SLC13 family permease [Myxococcota bacterium]